MRSQSVEHPTVAVTISVDNGPLVLQVFFVAEVLHERHTFFNINGLAQHPSIRSPLGRLSKRVHGIHFVGVFAESWNAVVRKSRVGDVVGHDSRIRQPLNPVMESLLGKESIVASFCWCFPRQVDVPAAFAHRSLDGGRPVGTVLAYVGKLVAPLAITCFV